MSVKNGNKMNMEKRKKAALAGPWARFKCFGKNEDGAAAVEFAIVAFPFFVIIGAIFEMALTFFANTMMDIGAQDIARLVRTKQVTASTHSPQQFKKLVCDRPSMAYFDCNRLNVDVQQVIQFGNSAPPRNPDGSLNTSGMTFNPGGANSIVIMRVYYDHPVLLDWMQGLGGNATPTGRLMVATQAFMIEP